MLIEPCSEFFGAGFFVLWVVWWRWWCSGASVSLTSWSMWGVRSVSVPSNHGVGEACNRASLLFRGRSNRDARSCQPSSCPLLSTPGLRSCPQTLDFDIAVDSPQTLPHVHPQCSHYFAAGGLYRLRVYFSPGDTIVRRYTFLDGRIGAVFAVRVVSDDERGLLTWVSPGSATTARTVLGDEPTGYVSCNANLFEPTMHRPAVWRSPGTLMLSPPGAAHSVWWFFDDNGNFKRWYVNLETVGRRWPGGRDCVDQALDIWIEPDRAWTWKDEDEFTEFTGRPGYWGAEEAAAIRAEGERVIMCAQAGRFPFDGTLCDFIPDPSWRPTPLPWWWDQTPDQTHAIRPEIR